LLDSATRENYTFVSCFTRVIAASMSASIGSAGKRNQAKHQNQKATHSGNAIHAFPEVFNGPVFMRVLAMWLRRFARAMRTAMLLG